MRAEYVRDAYVFGSAPVGELERYAPCKVYQRVIHGLDPLTLNTLLP